jgi:YidC/Oxa1 family membrane protein insertase
MEKRVILALGLSLLILIGFQLVMSKYYPVRNAANVPKKEMVEETAPVQKEEPVVISPTINRQILANEREAIFQNNIYTATFTDIGAGIKKITLNQNPKAGLNISYDILDIKDPAASLFLFLSDKTGAELNNAKYDVRKSEDEVVFTHNFNNELVVEKRYRFSNSLYRIELEIIFKNLKGADITKSYSLISVVHLPSPSIDERSLEISANIDGKVVKDKKSGKAHELQRSGNLSWIMLKGKYFSVITRPASNCTGYTLQQDAIGKLAAGLNMQPFVIPSNSSIKQDYGVYLGPTDIGLLKTANIGAEGALTSGFLGSIGQLLMNVLKFFYMVTRNWGVAIILLAIFINIVLYPLTRKSYKSMHEMQVLQPKIEKLRKEHKGNPQKLQKEIMELYKKYKVNPMGGCLPLLLQMPIFFALYQGLINFVELKGSGFLWIRDLSLPENIKMPFTLPLVSNNLNILPIFMIVAMFFQQRLSNKLTAMTQTDEQRQQQKIMTVMMTIMFGFIFYNMPSGFVLYWLASTVVMTLIQYMFMRKPKQAEEYA